MAVYITQREGAEPGDDHADICISMKGFKVLRSVRDTAMACPL